MVGGGAGEGRPGAGIVGGGSRFAGEEEHTSGGGFERYEVTGIERHVLGRGE